MDEPQLWRALILEAKSELPWIPDLMESGAVLSYLESQSELRVIFRENIKYGYYKTKDYEGYLQEIASRVLGKEVCLKVLREPVDKANSSF